MILHKSNLVHFLVDRGLVDAGRVADGGLSMREIPRHNRNFAVALDGAPGLFVKQPFLRDELSLACVRREAECYRLARDTAAWEPLRGLLPTLVHYDEAGTTLVVELLDGAESMQDHHARFRAFPTGTARRLGAALGACHRIPAGDAALQALSFTRPWVLFRELLPVQLAGEPTLSWVLECVNETPPFRAALDALAGEWRNDALIHADMKWENCLVRGGDGGEGEPELRLVDWELAGAGDSAWDLGGALHSYLSCWVLGLPLDAAASPQAMLRCSAYPVSAIHPAVRALWAAYVQARGLDADEARVLLRRAVGLTGARLVQTTWEYGRTAAAVPAYRHLLLQLAMNVATRPAEAARTLLGLGVDG